MLHFVLELKPVILVASQYMPRAGERLEIGFSAGPSRAHFVVARKDSSTGLLAVLSIHPHGDAGIESALKAIRALPHGGYALNYVFDGGDSDLFGEPYAPVGKPYLRVHGDRRRDFIDPDHLKHTPAELSSQIDEYKKAIQASESLSV